MQGFSTGWIVTLLSTLLWLSVCTCACTLLKIALDFVMPLFMRIVTLLLMLVCAPICTLHAPCRSSGAQLATLVSYILMCALSCALVCAHAHCHTLSWGSSGAQLATATRTQALVWGSQSRCIASWAPQLTCYLMCTTKKLSHIGLRPSELILPAGIPNPLATARELFYQDPLYPQPNCHTLVWGLNTRIQMQKYTKIQLGIDKHMKWKKDKTPTVPDCPRLQLTGGSNQNMWWATHASIHHILLVILDKAMSFGWVCFKTSHKEFVILHPKFD